jgi:hypothetical protein
MKWEKSWSCSVLSWFAIFSMLVLVLSFSSLLTLFGLALLGLVLLGLALFVLTMFNLALFFDDHAFGRR